MPRSASISAKRGHARSSLESCRWVVSRWSSRGRLGERRLAFRSFELSPMSRNYCYLQYFRHIIDVELDAVCLRTSWNEHETTKLPECILKFAMETQPC